MAILGKIRSKGTFLIIVIGLGLFGFIAGDMFRSCETTGRMSSTRVGEILGEKIGIEDYQNYLNEFVECTKITSPQADEDQIRSSAWNAFVQNKIIQHEAEKLGLTVTNDEMRNVMMQGSHQVLMEVANVTGLVNQQTGRFDFNLYNEFLNNYKTQRNQNPQAAEYYDKIYKFLAFKVKQLREQLLTQKYQVLLTSAILSNPVEAKFLFDAEKQESDIKLAYIDYKSINDNDVKIDESELKSKYDEKKEMFKIPEEIRSIKYILVKKIASAADRNALTAALNKCAQKLKDGEDPEKVVREGRSNIAYLGVPVTKKAFTNDIANRLDSMAVGAVMGPVESQMDNTMNVIKLISKSTLPDSIQYRTISVVGKTNEETKTKADSVYNALVAGGDFETIAKKYAQTGEKAWLTTSQYERASNMTKDNQVIFNAINTLGVNEIKNIPMTQGALILQVVDRKAMVTKYDVAIVKCDITYSDETSHNISNKFKQFVAGHQSLEAMEKDAAKSGYQVLEAKNVMTSQGGISGIGNSRDALKWVFEADKNDISEVMTVGNNRDEILVMALTGIYPKGYMPVDNEDVKNYIQQEVLRDKKAEKIMEKLNGVKSIAQAESKGAKTTDVNQITFASPVFVSDIQSQEPALSGAVAATEKGKFSAHPVKGYGGVFVFNVNDRRTVDGKFDAKEYQARAAQNNASMVTRSVFQELFINADVKDNRYLFF
jgi:peptidyl-prolyl cis-trans isomerase D